MLGCMFGSTGLPLVSGTKLHVRPSRTMVSRSTQQNDVCPGSPEQVTSQSNMRRRTPLTRSTTADNLHLMSASAPAERVESHLSRSQSASVLITRLFTIDASESLSPRSNSSGAQGPLPETETQQQDCRSARRSSSISEPPSARQFKCPAYAISLMIQLPSASRQGWSAAPQVTSPMSPDSVGTSTENLWQEAKAPDGSPDGPDRDIEQVIIHWRLLTKLLDSYESVMRRKISNLLASADLAPNHPPMHASLKPVDKSMSDRSKLPVKGIKQPSQRTIQLPAEALQKLEDVQHEVSKFRQRVILLLRTRRVVTGQGRWGVWREEARWVRRWAGNREQNFFFYNLLTAFLGFHLDWLESLEGIRARLYRSRSEKSRHAGPINQQQTVIVSPNKMASRRLIFLLAIFLPSTIPRVYDAMVMPKSHMVGSSFSQSPPSGIPILRELSLRRTINRRQRGNRSSQGSAAFHNRSLSFAGEASTLNRNEDQIVQSRSAQHSRRTSTARSIVTPVLAIAASGENNRKSSTTTTSTIVPETAAPVAHFSAFSPDPALGTTPALRPGSSGSLASLSLQHALQRSESNEQSNASTASQSLGRWGSMMSGFWSGRRESFTEEGESLPTSTEGLGISGMSKMPVQSSYTRMSERTVEQAEAVSQAKRKSDTKGQSSQGLSGTDTLREALKQATGPEPGASVTEARAIPERPKDEIFPVKLSVDDNDGIIDVDLSAPDTYASSFESPVGSPRASCTAPNSFNERSSIFTRSPSKERPRRLSESSTNVAGWLKDYSPDFVLQAVKPYQGLRNDIKEALRAPPASETLVKRTKVGDDESHGWRDVRTALVADATTFSIIRVCFQQRLRTRKQPPAGAPPSVDSGPAEHTIEERIVEEPIMDHDPVLIDAVERILAQSGHPSRVQSQTPSRATSPSRSVRPLERAKPKSHYDLDLVPRDKENTQTPATEVPKSECKKLVLGALEEVVRSVQAEQDGETKGARHLSGEPVRDGKEEFPQGSTLREGVRRWLRETGPVAVAS